jgi:polysaccharide biosynthesis/export protein
MNSSLAKLVAASARLAFAVTAATLLFWTVSAKSAGDVGTDSPEGVALQNGYQAQEDRRLIQLGPGDQLRVDVYGQPDMSGALYVGDDGNVSIPLVGPVQIAGLSPVEAAGRVEKALKDGQFLVDPHVTIAVLEVRNQRVSVLGEVQKPGRYAIDPNTSIFELLADAGGVTQTSGEVISIQRTGPDGSVTRYPVNLKSLDGGMDLVPGKALRGGDQIFVPTAEQYYIYGEVANPNKYRIEPGMTVIQAIARAGGITQRGSERRVIIKRAVQNGQTITVHPRPDEQVQPGDVIRVKESIF